MHQNVYMSACVRVLKISEAWMVTLMYDLKNNKHLSKGTRETYLLQQIKNGKGKVKNENRADNSES